MRFVSKMVALTLGQEDEVGEVLWSRPKTMLVWCSKGLGYHKHTEMAGRWSVTHLKSGCRLDPVPEGFPDEGTCKRFIEFAFTFEVPWSTDLADQRVARRPVEGTPLSEYQEAVRSGWASEDRPAEDDPIMDLFGAS